VEKFHVVINQSKAPHLYAEHILIFFTDD